LIFYFVFLLFVPLVVIDTAKTELWIRHALLFVITLILIFIAGFRSGFPDYPEYINIFNNARQGNIKANYDIGYTIINILVGSIFNNSISIFLLVAFLAVTINIKCYRDYCRYAFLAILFYYVHSYYLKELIQIRTGLSCAICLYNVRNIGERKKINFIFLQVIAASIHMASLIFFVVPIINILNIRIRTWYTIIFIVLIIGIVFPFGRIVKALQEIEYLSRIQIYVKWDEHARALGIFRNPTTMKQLIVSILMLYFFPFFNKRVRFFHVMLLAYLSSTCWLILWNDFSILAARVATFLSVGEPIFVASLLYLFPKYFRPFIAFLLICLAVLILYLNVGRNLGQYKLIFHAIS
jgi:hypothetical protein